jgi:hypothetical protein
MVFFGLLPCALQLLISTSGPAFTPLPLAPQKIYTAGGVPHTDRQGRRLAQYDARRSFLPLVLYDAQIDCSLNPAGSALQPSAWLGQNCLPRGVNASLYVAAGFNAVLPYDINPMRNFMGPGFVTHELQIIVENQGGDIAEVQQYHNHSSLLGWYLREEPTGNGKRQADFDKYQTQKAAIKAIDAVHPVFVIDTPWQGTDTEWWTRWNSAGDVSSHDNYVFDYSLSSMVHMSGHGGGLPQTVSMASSINNFSKPVWMCLAAFESGPWTMATPRQMRAQVYASLVMGATGIIYFAMDSQWSRAGGVVGMGPRPLLAQQYCETSLNDSFCAKFWPYSASPSLLDMAATAWDATVKLNAELHELTPCLLSPTSGEDMLVSFAALDDHAGLHTPTPIRAIRKRCAAVSFAPAGTDIIIAVNVDKGPIMAQFVVHRSTPANTSIAVLFEGGRSVDVTPQTSEYSRFIDKFESMDTHIYLLPPLVTGDSRVELKL